MQNELKERQEVREIGEILQECHRQAQILREKSKELRTLLRKMREDINQILGDQAHTVD